MNKFNLALIIAIAALPVGAIAQSPMPAAAKDKTRQDFSQKKSPHSLLETLRKGRHSAGLFTVYEADNKWYVEIPDSLLDREILVVNRIAKAATAVRAGMLGFGGDEINENTIAFTRGPQDKIFIKSLSYTDVAGDSSANGLYRSVSNSNLQPLVAAFDNKATAADSTVLIDVTDYVNGDNEVLFFDPGAKKALGLMNLLPDRSYIQGIRSFPGNIGIHTVKTYLRSSMTSMGPTPPAPATYEVSSSLVLLPRTPMHPRYADDRIGYFRTAFTDFDANPEGVQQTAMITRWRLEPRDTSAYLRGELTEPVKPIVYYIDPATPAKWVPYLIQGVEDWNAAFEHAGFKNAIRALPAPVGDSSWDLDDAAHNAIVYKSSPVPNASGPNVHDPRSGEIMETHINWYHNVMELLRHWYMIQAGAVDPKARTPQLGDSLMGQLIRFVVSHEVGHTLGLMHNFGASSTVPVDSLRSRRWLDQHGHTPSIMDYARFNYVAQPEDSIPEIDLFPRIGAYDKWAIEWGYRWFPETVNPETVNRDPETREAQRIRLNQWVIMRTTGHPDLWFGSEADRDDPRDQSEDLGDNAMTAGAYGIKNLQRILPQLPGWTREPAKDYTELGVMYQELTDQLGRYMGHVVRNIGGIETNPKTVEERGPVTSFVPKSKQQEAMRFLQVQLFTTPDWLLDKKVFALTGDDPAETLGKLQQAVVARLLSAATLGRLILFQTQDPTHAYTAEDMVSELTRGIFSELAAHRPIDIYRRHVQKAYIQRVVALLKSPANATNPSRPGATAPLDPDNDERSVIRAQARELLQQIKTALPAVTDPATRLHLQDCADRLTTVLHPKE